LAAFGAKAKYLLPITLAAIEKCVNEMRPSKLLKLDILVERMAKERDDNAYHILVYNMEKMYRQNIAVHSDYEKQLSIYKSKYEIKD